jgi:hypothetical protein
VSFSPEIEATRSAKVTKDLVHDAFPDWQAWLLINPPETELRWADGVRHDERLALIVVQSIERALAVRLGLNRLERALGM